MGPERQAAISNTVCIIPWTNFVVRPDGSASFCCEIPPALTVGGKTGHIARDGFDDLWNAPEIVGVRAAMARGAKPASCRACWDREAEGGISRRLLMNATYRGFGAPPIETLADIGAETDYRLERRPYHFILDMGNVCNLKCRSCSGFSSSRIAADAVHAAWNGGDTPSSEVIRVDGKRWFEDIDAMATMLEASADTDIVLTLMGGEPFLIPSVWKLLSELVDRGLSRRIYVGLLSNGQASHPKLEEMLPHFRGFNVSFSIDGHGKLYEYLRHGGSWRAFVRTLDRLSAIPDLTLCVVPTLQNANALGMVDLLRFLDERGVRVLYNVVNDPARLSHTCLPSGVRRVAERRLRDYLDHECRPENVAVVRAYCEALEPQNDAFDPDRFREFMEFTNDLDASRGESLRDAAPELWALLRASGIEWSNARRHVSADADALTGPLDAVAPVNRTIHEGDRIFPGFEAAAKDAYFTSAAQHVAEIDALLRASGHQGLKDAVAVADVGCHYGRVTRALRAALPAAAVYACDIDADAVRFCAEELGALPVTIGWKPEDDALPADLDAIVCFSLLTHTTLEHWRASLRAWANMLRPGGAAAFTYLSDRRLGAWRAGEMAHYGEYSAGAHDEVERAVRETGFGFTALTREYGGEPYYGITFVTPELVAREIEAAGLELLALPDDLPSFGQELAIVRKPAGEAREPAAAPSVKRDVRVVALYDPRGYVTGDGADADESMWSRLLASVPARPLPTELGFADARIADVREAQASLAAEHGIDAFCYRYRWNAGPSWDAPLRDLVASGRPAFPFCVLIEIEDTVPIARSEAERLFDELISALADPRYLRVDGRPLVVVHDIARFAEPRESAAAWRAAARAANVGELHLSTLDAGSGDRPENLGFDSYVIAPVATAHAARDAAEGMTVPWPAHHAFRMVRAARDTSAPETAETYEFWLQSAIEETRRRGEPLLFLDSWNDWFAGTYLEPDDRGGRTLLQATKRAVRGPASGLTVLRRLRDALASNEHAVPGVLGELESVLTAHEHGRERLFALVEASLVRSVPPGEEVLRRLPVQTRHLQPSGGQVMLDYFNGAGGATLHEGTAPVYLHGDEAIIAGWAHSGDSAPDLVDLFVAFESETGVDDAIFRVAKRLARPDVVANHPDYPEHCGFEATLPLRDVPPGTYRVAIVQRTRGATYRDATPVTAVREETRCSSD